MAYEGGSIFFLRTLARTQEGTPQLCITINGYRGGLRPIKGKLFPSREWNLWPGWRLPFYLGRSMKDHPLEGQNHLLCGAVSPSHADEIEERMYIYFPDLQPPLGQSFAELQSRSSLFSKMPPSFPYPPHQAVPVYAQDWPPCQLNPSGMAVRPLSFPSSSSQWVRFTVWDSFKL